MMSNRTCMQSIRKFVIRQAISHGQRPHIHMVYRHHANLLLLDGKLYLAPIPANVQNVLDVGTGIGQVS